MSILSLALSLVAGGSLPICSMDSTPIPQRDTMTCQTPEGGMVYLWSVPEQYRESAGVSHDFELIAMDYACMGDAIPTGGKLVLRCREWMTREEYDEEVMPR